MEAVVLLIMVVVLVMALILRVIKTIQFMVVQVTDVVVMDPDKDDHQETDKDHMQVQRVLKIGILIE